MAVAVILAALPVFISPSWILALQGVCMLAVLRAVCQVAGLSHARRERKVRAQMQQNEARASFLAATSRGIRTPLQGVVSMCELLRDTELTAEQRDYVDAAQHCGQLVLAVADDIRVPGQLELCPVAFDLRERLDTLLTALGAQARLKGLDLTLDVPSHLPERVVGDPVRLEQVLLHLVGNAIQVTDEGGVEIRAGQLRRSSGTLRLAFWIRDTGRPENRTPCPLTQRLVQSMQGRLVLQSSDEHGTTFMFDLVLAVSPESQPAPLAGDPVLLVEPCPSRRRGALHQIESVGTPVVGCASLEEALRLHQASPYSYRAVLVRAGSARADLPAGLPAVELATPLSRRQIRRALAQ